MAIEFRLPDLGENIESGDVVNVLVNVGDEITANQAIVELETDKAVVEVPCSHAGKITAIHVAKGQSVPVGGLLVTLEAVGSAGAAAAPSKPAKAQKEKQPAKAQEQPEPAKAAKAAPKAERNGPESRPSRAPAKPPAPEPVASSPATDEAEGDDGLAAPAGPATRRLARELGVDLARVSGSGPGGRITREDVIAAVRQFSSGANAAPVSTATSGGGTATAPAKSAKSASRPAPAGTPGTDSYGAVRRERMSKIRKTIAVNMARSSSTIPHVTNFDDADITELEQIRKTSATDHDGRPVKLTMLAFVLKAVAQSLRQHPTLNASLDLEAEEIVYKDYVNVGVAVDTERGLVVPVMRNADRMSIPQIGQGLTGMAAQARSAQFAIEDLRGGTFTISNLGAVGGTYSTPIINHPEVAVLLVGRSRMLPKWIGDKFEPRLMMPLSLSYDHRLVDGAAAARFLNEVIEYLQTPGRLLLAT
ncbi:MAG: 2-oxo acid dehydrogenase subunit E2 [Pirellulales bacterium]|nr:2-oxo acid dehydrogenase subunit E2 [Pirellulales bacterium]